MIPVRHQNIERLVQNKQARQGFCGRRYRFPIKRDDIALFRRRCCQRHNAVDLHPALGHHALGLAPASNAGLLPINIEPH